MLSITVGHVAPMIHSVVLLLGSNIDKERNLPAAVRLLAAETTITAISPVYESSPVGSREKLSFFNAAALIQTEKTAVELKDGLIGAIERRLGRIRQADRNAPRTIDLDIVLYDDAILDYTPADGAPRHIPDPDLLRFAYCALPVADLLPEMKHPETGETLRAIAERLTATEGQSAIRRSDIDLRPGLQGKAPNP
jgi:2-amino-4-hydroxy-6-hydroxymethyldihydropteridine diphosphokinase